MKIEYSLKHGTLYAYGIINGNSFELTSVSDNTDNVFEVIADRATGILNDTRNIGIAEELQEGKFTFGVFINGFYNQVDYIFRDDSGYWQIKSTGIVFDSFRQAYTFLRRSIMHDLSL